MDVNKVNRIYAHSRILYQQGKVWEGIKDFSTSPALAKKLQEMIAMPEEKMNSMTIEEYFGDTFPEFQKHPHLVVLPHHAGLQGIPLHD